MKDRAEKAEAQIEAAETRAADAEARAKAAELAASLAEDALAADRKHQQAVVAEACRQTLVAAFQEIQDGHFENHPDFKHFKMAIFSLLGLVDTGAGNSSAVGS